VADWAEERKKDLIHYFKFQQHTNVPIITTTTAALATEMMH